MSAIRRAWPMLLLVAALIRPPLVADERPPVFHRGVDLSYVNEMEDCGAVYRDAQGQPRDAFALFADLGATLVRARLWHDPDWTDYSTLDDVTLTFRRAADAGMMTLLAFHYSDTWADPANQHMPAAWQDLPDEDALAQAVYDYTYTSLMHLHREGLLPPYVQIGNEINNGLIKQEPGLDWPRDVRLLNAGIQAARDVADETEAEIDVVLHIAQPENVDWWFTEAVHAGIAAYDVIGLSYYPQWSDYDINDLVDALPRWRSRFGRPVMVVETAYPWTQDYADAAHNLVHDGLPAYPISPDGQRRYLLDLRQALTEGGALGMVYWEPAWVSTECSTLWGQGSHWENAALFDFNDDNRLLPGADFLAQADTATN